MKKRMKKVATLCLAGVTAMSTVGVTGSAVFAKGDTNYDVDNMDFENVELRVAFRFNNGSDTDGQAKWYYKALDEFNKENEGKIHVTDESISTESDYEEKLTTDFASGNVPNAFLQYGGSRTREYVDAGYILDLTPYFEQYPEWKEGVQDFAWETTQFDGIEGTYGIPWSAYQLCLYYNKDYLDQVGVDVPESWDDLVDACAKLKDAGIQPFNYSDKDNYHFEHLMSALALKAYGTNYGQIDIIWFDFSYDDMRGEKWGATKLINMVRSLQPQVIIDNRLEASGEGRGSLYECDPTPYHGDFVSPEQIIPPEGICDKEGNPMVWEACFTMNNNWGYCANDHYYKPASMLIKKLVECVSKGGNMILNVGPDAKGKFPKESSAILAEIGRWMDKNHDSIYGCVPAENIPKPDYGRITRNGNKYYVHIYENTLGPLPLLGFDKDKIVKVRALDDGHEVPISNAWMHSDYPDIAFVDLGPDPVLPDPVDYVLEVEMAE